MSTLDLYTKGTKVWISNVEHVWEGAELLENYDPKKKTLKLQRTDNKETKTLTIKSEQDLPFLRNPENLVGENDLTSLSYLHEPAVLHNLQVRFCQKESIYTYCGIVLVAVNPYHELPIYGIDTIQSYRGQPMGDLEPHIFAVAEDAYTQMEREQRDQSIIVSGESGAGKTVSAKYAMRYFATVGGSATETQIEKKVLASSPIMEAIGNAKTTRNDNSSRFGKFIELQFNTQNSIIGASMRTYLLEKSRVVLQASDERNYHIFYQMCAARKKYPQLHLTSCRDFEYLNQGDSPLVSGVDDEKAYMETLSAFNLLGFADHQIEDITKILAGVLHLGNLEIRKSKEVNEHCEVLQNNHLKTLGELMEINTTELQQWLCVRKIQSMRDVIMKPMTLEESLMSRNALAKHIYAELFNWIVLIINKALETDAKRHKFIGVLDIYGFETFETNSFEQFCINYANEKLQQQFNMHVFKLEQEEYLKEEIAWTMIDFYDNQPCIDLIEAKLGILDLLDEECKMPKGSDKSWVDKLYSKCTKFPHFEKARFGTTAFVIKHFADKVQYESDGFLEKNRDTVIEEQINVFKKSTNNLVKRLFVSQHEKVSKSSSTTKLKIVSTKPSPAMSSKTNKKTVGSQFRDSLNMLMSTLNATTPHYVRCIKPNDTKTSFDFNPKRAVEQLRACGVLETVRISAAGFPSRWSYCDFYERYRVLCNSKDVNRPDLKLTCRNILEKHLKCENVYAYGKTKIFFRAGQVAYLEKLRSEKLLRCCIIMQSTIRAFICRKKYLRAINAIYNLQRYARGYLARRLADHLRRTKAATAIQRYTRGWVKRIQYQRIKRLILGIQCYARGLLARKRYLVLKYNAKALTIQRYYRGWLARRHVIQRRRKIVLCQAVIRRFLARRKYKKLRIEARSIEHVKKLNKGLENKIFMLQQKIEDLNKNKNEAQAMQNEINELKNRMTTFKGMELEVKNLKTLLVNKNDKIRNLEEKVEREREEKVDLINEQEKAQREIESERQHWVKETSKLRKELDNINEVLKLHEEGAEQKIKMRLEEEKILLQRQQDNDAQAYQKLLEEYNNLEAHCENLQDLISEQNRLNYSRVTNTNDDSKLALDDNHSDYGYGSVRSTGSPKSTHPKIDSVDWKVDTNPESAQTSSSESEHTRCDHEKIDAALIIRLQHKLSQVDREKTRLEKRLDDLEMSPRAENAEKSIADSIRISELELELAALKAQLIELRSSVLDGTGKEKLAEQFKNVQLEMDRKIDEIIQLKSVLSNQAENLRSLVNSKTRTGEYINEDGELALAYETQKTINKQLELELQDEKMQYKAREKEYQLEISKLRDEVEKQQTILAANLQMKPESQNERFLQKEIERVATENLNLIESNESHIKTNRELKMKIKTLNKALKQLGVDTKQVHNEVNEDVSQVVQQINKMPSIKKRTKQYLGMFAFNDGDENLIMKPLVYDLKPRTAVTLLPGLPAYILFMCIRHTDYIDNEERVKVLLAAYCSSVKKVVRKRKDDLETKVLWLANSVCLLNTMKQYSGEVEFQSKNTDVQNQQRLVNFDLSEYRRVLADACMFILSGVIGQICEIIQPLIVPAILEYEEIQGISGGKSGFRRRGNSVADTPVENTKPTQALLQELTSKHKILVYYGVTTKVISQIFKQVFYFICASSLNNLLLRKELCHWSKGFQIRHNLSYFEMWTREKQLEEQEINETLKPIIQAAQLLQARKQDEDVESVCDMCSRLTPLQICKILNLYTPVDEFEQRVPVSFVKKVQSKLQKDKPTASNESVLMDIQFRFAIILYFEPSSIRFQDIEIPEVLNLPMLKKV